MLEVVGIGVPYVDLVVNIDALPTHNQGTQMRGYSWQGGGKVPTALVALSRLGAKVGMVCTVGDDSFGRFTIDDFQRHGVDTTQVVVEPGGRTPFSVILSDSETKGRSIIWHPGKLRGLSREILDWDYVLSTKVVHVSASTEVDLEVCRRAKELGIPVAIDADGFCHEILQLAPYVDHFIASEDFALDYDGTQTPKEVAQSIAKLGPSVVVITLGKRGCIYYDHKNIGAVAAFQVEVKDSLGAGDVFHGGYLYGVLQGWEVEECCRFASAVSAMKCTQMGGRAGIPTLEEVQHFLSTGEVVLDDADRLLELYSRMPGFRA